MFKRSVISIYPSIHLLTSQWPSPVSTLCQIVCYIWVFNRLFHVIFLSLLVFLCVSLFPSIPCLVEEWLLHQLGPPSLKSFTGEFSGSPHLPAHLPKPLSQNKKRPMLRQTKQAVSLLSFDLKYNHLKHFYTLACGLTCMGLPLVSLSGYCTCELNCPLGSHWLTSQSAFACCCKWLHLQLVLL